MHCDFWLFLVKQKISSDSMCLVYTFAIKTNHLGNGALFQFCLNSLQIFQLVGTGFGHKNMKKTVVITKFSISGIDMNGY